MEYSKIENGGKYILRYGLAIVLIWIGVLKFTSYEATGIQPLVEHSPLLSWSYQFMTVEGFASLIGFIEVAAGLLIASRPFSSKLAVAGGMIGLVTFITTLTLLFSTPGVLQSNYSFPYISPMPGQFVLKDIVLLGAAVFTTGEALLASKRRYKPTIAL